MLIWLNGAFGVGKTHTAQELMRKIPGSVIADPELLGFGIQRMFPQPLRGDFQETPWWAPTTAAILTDVALRHPGDVIVPMSLSHHDRHQKIFDTLREGGVDARHFTLVASRATVRRRLRTRLEGHKSWAMQSYQAVDAALRDPYFSVHIPTDGVALPDVVSQIGTALGHDIRYSIGERLLLPARRLAVKIRHIR